MACIGTVSKRWTMELGPENRSMIIFPVTWPLTKAVSAAMFGELSTHKVSFAPTATTRIRLTQTSWHAFTKEIKKNSH